MEERGGARRISQRMLDDPPAPGPTEELEGRPQSEDSPSEAISDETPPAPRGPRGPSDTELRKRQRAWQQERARFEASKAARAVKGEGPK